MIFQFRDSNSSRLHGLANIPVEEVEHLYWQAGEDWEIFGRLLDGFERAFEKSENFCLFVLYQDEDLPAYILLNDRGEHIGERIKLTYLADYPEPGKWQIVMDILAKKDDKAPEGSIKITSDGQVIVDDAIDELYGISLGGVYGIEG